MSGLVDYAALVVDLRGRLRQRSSWGLPQLRALIDDLEQQHRIDEAAEARMLRRHSDLVASTFLGLLPTRSDRPLTPADPVTDPGRDGETTTIRSLSGEDE